MAVKKTKVQPKENFFDRATRWVNQFEDSFVNFISVIIPWLVPLIPAWIMYDHVTNKETGLGWEKPLGFIAGAVVEGLGLATINTYFRFERHNKRYKDQKNKMPLWVVIVAYGWYLAIILFVNVVLDWIAGVHWTRIVAITAFSTLSLPASALISVRGMYSEWKGEHDKKYARSDEQPAEQPEQKPVQERSPERSDEQEIVRPSDREQEIIAYLNRVYKDEQRIAGPSEVARALKLDVTKAKGYISGKTQEWKETLQANGASA
jgi:hypothetical protein